jgi:hypothetical protein
MSEPGSRTRLILTQINLGHQWYLTQSNGLIADLLAGRLTIFQFADSWEHLQEQHKTSLFRLLGDYNEGVLTDIVAPAA